MDPSHCKQCGQDGRGLRPRGKGLSQHRRWCKEDRGTSGTFHIFRPPYLITDPHVDAKSQGKSAIIAGEDNKPVETLEFFFIESTIRSSALTDIKFKEDINAWNSMKKGIELAAAMGTTWYINDNDKGGLNQTFSNTLGVTISNSQSFQSSKAKGIGLTVGLAAKVKAKVPFFGETEITGNADRKFEYTDTDMDGREDKRDFAFSFLQGAQFSTGVPPQSATNCTITSTVGKFVSDYTATITVQLENDKEFTFLERGQATTVNHVDTTSRCKTMALKDMPTVGSDQKVVKGNDVQNKKRTVEEGVVEPIARGLKRAIKFFA
jgi:hypothetical protein